MAFIPVNVFVKKNAQNCFFGHLYSQSIEFVKNKRTFAKN